MEKKLSSIFSGTAFYVSLAVCLVAVGIGGWFLLFGQKEENPPVPIPNYETVTDTTTSAVVEVPTIPQEPEPEAAAPAEPVSMPEEIIEEVPVIAQAPRLIVEPLQGEVLTAFSVDELLYDPTMEDWRIHAGVDIAAGEGAEVMAAASGTVMAVRDDAMLGTTVVIGHEGGYQSTYANLQADPQVAAGDHVSAGQIIGAVGTTAAAESAQTPHLHFAVTKDGDVVDPQDFLKG